MIDRDLTVGLDAQINNNLNVDGGLVVGDDTSLQDVTAKSIEVAKGKCNYNVSKHHFNN